MAGKRKSIFRRIVAWLHLWLGLVSGLVVFVVSITGCLYVFQEEISNVYYDKVFFIKADEAAVLPISELQQKAQNVLGAEKPIEGFIAYSQPDRAWEFMAYKENDSALTYFGALPYFNSVFVNPHTGEITGTRNYRTDFFNVVKYIHWSLLLSTPYGQPIVGWSTMIFVILLVTGLVLWYPKKWNRSTKQQAFKIKFKAGFKRLNYDLHNVPGFYAMMLALVLAITGMVFSFTWFEKFVYVVAAASTVPPEEKEVKSVIPTTTKKVVNPLDIAFNSAVAEFTNINRMGVFPGKGPEATISFYLYKKKEVYYDFDELQYDQYSGKLLYRKNNAEKNRGEKLLGMNYDIHIGAIGGIGGKILAFIISLVCASLPVTGFLIWWHKRKKKNVSVAV